MNHDRNNFDGVRLIGALAVLISHQLALQGIGGRLMSVIGGAGVALFFGVSGYLVTASWLSDPHVGRFFARRLLRVWPGLALVVGMLSIALTVMPYPDPLDRLLLPATVPAFLSNLAFVQWDGAYFPHSLNPGLNQPLWTIPNEMRCYALLALVGIVSTARLRVLVLLGMAIALSLAADRRAELVAIFTAGALIRLYPRTGVLLALASSAVVPMIGVAVGAVLLGRLSTPVLRDAARFGDLSYGVYLWGWPVQQVGLVLYGRGTPWLLLVTLAWVLSIAWLSWHLVESQALRMKPDARRLRSPALGDPRDVLHDDLLGRCGAHLRRAVRLSAARDPARRPVGAPTEA